MQDPWYKLVLSLFDGFFYVTTCFWRERGVLAAPLPLTTGSISSPMGLGSDSTPVRVNLYGIGTYLADSQQFALELLCRVSNSGAYYVMPSFRGEPNDNRHLGQFIHSEAELPAPLEEIMRVAEDYLLALARFFLAQFEEELEAAAGTLQHLEHVIERHAPFTKITFEEAVDELKDVPGGITRSAKGDWRALSNAGERALIERLGEFTWVTHFDDLAVPFYQAVDDDSSYRRSARNADLLFGIGETVGAGERHATAEQVRDALRRHEVPPEPYHWYIRMREEHPMRTSGFGMGVERFFLWLLRHDDIRDLMILVRANGVDIVP